MDLDLRKLRYFAAVARHQHFGRAAEQLYIAQPVLSRQVRALEKELGCELFVRTTRNVRLTPAGEQLLQEADGILASVDAAVRRVNEVEHGTDRLVIAFASGLQVSAAVRAYAAANPDVGIDLMPANWWEQDAPLRDGRAHVGFLRRYFDETGLRVIPVGSEPRVVSLPATHRLAKRRVVRMAELAGEAVLDSPARWTFSGEQKLELIAAGQGIAIVPRSAALVHARDDIVHRVVKDAEPVELCLVVPKGQRQRRVLDFVSIATDALRDRKASLRAV